MESHLARRSLVFFVLVCALVTTASAQVLPWSVKIEKVLDNTAEAGDIALSPTGEIWLLERAGTLRVFRDGAQVASLAVPVSTTCESGLLDVAFDPNYASNGRAAISYVSGTGQVRVDEVTRVPGGVDLGGMLIDLGTTASGCRPGGGLETSADGKLLVAVGDLGVGADAQDDAKFAGKLLRAEFNGAVPADNPSGTLVWAKGFRHGADLAQNPNTARANGTVYMTDRGSSTVAADEVNAPGEGGNFGWDSVSGSGGGFDDPIVSYNPVVGTEGLATITTDKFGAAAEGSLTFACLDVDEIRQATVSGAEGDALDDSGVFYNPVGDRDGTPDAGCPGSIHALGEGGDGWLYGVNDGANPGVWRMYQDTMGPREVSAPGSPFRFTVAKSGGDLEFGWEDLGSLDAGFPARDGGQHTQTYTIWEGSLPITSYDHTALLRTDGNSSGLRRLTATTTPGSGDRYYLVTAQGENVEGSAGQATDGTERNEMTDYCQNRGVGQFIGDCADEFRHVDTGEIIKLTDYNPRSPTYLQEVGLSDYRGRVIHIDLSADDCFWCNVQADFFHDVDVEFRDRDFVLLVIFTQNIGGFAYADINQCITDAAAWADTHNEDSPILCDIPRVPNPQNSDERRGAVTYNYWHASSGTPPGEDCGGTPQNLFVDQAGVVYDFQCGAFLSSTAVDNIVGPETNPETCE